MNEPTPNGPHHVPTNRRHKGGRPSKLTPKVRRRLLKLVALGCPYNMACSVARISAESFRTYRRAHPEFAEQIERAVGLAVERRLRTIQRAANSGDVNSAKWMLEHLHPQHFAKTRIEVSGPDGSPLAGVIAVCLPPKNGEPATEINVVAEPHRLTEGSNGN